MNVKRMKSILRCAFVLIETEISSQIHPYPEKAKLKTAAVPVLPMTGLPQCAITLENVRLFTLDSLLVAAHLHNAQTRP